MKRYMVGRAMPPAVTLLVSLGDGRMTHEGRCSQRVESKSPAH